MLKSLPHNVPVNIRPCGVSFPNDEAVSGDNSQTDAEAGLKRRAEVVQREFEVFLLLQGDVWVGRFRENFLHKWYHCVPDWERVVSLRCVAGPERVNEFETGSVRV